MKRGKPVIPFIAPVTRPAPQRVELTVRERSQMRQQRILALQEIQRLRERQLAAIKEEIEQLEDAEEREAIQDEERGDYGGGPEEEFEFSEDMPDWESDEFLEFWDEDIEYEVFTVLS